MSELNAICETPMIILTECPMIKEKLVNSSFEVCLPAVKTLMAERERGKQRVTREESKGQRERKAKGNIESEEEHF